MNSTIKLTIICATFVLLCPLFSHTKTKNAPMKVQILVGSVRATDTGEKIAQNIKAVTDKNPKVTTEIVKLKDYNLPFYTDEVAPGNRTGEITDPTLKKWSDKIKEADAYIILVPEYNAGYPGSLKNALDSLYVEWKNKPVALVGYSGGPSGAASALTQLKVVIKRFYMIPIATDVNIPESWKAFNEDGTLKTDISAQLDVVIEQLIAAQP